MLSRLLETVLWRGKIPQAPNADLTVQDTRVGFVGKQKLSIVLGGGLQMNCSTAYDIDG